MIGAHVVIGDEVIILQNVSIGRRGELPARSPRIGRGVYIGAGATILGDISIGEFAKIGAGTVVTSATCRPAARQSAIPATDQLPGACLGGLSHRIDSQETCK